MKQLFSLTYFLPVSIIYLASLIPQVTAQQVPQINSQQLNFPEKTIDYLAQTSSITTKVKEIAEKITVRIDFPGGNGSGVIVAHQGGIYYVLTAKHVVEKEREYKIVTPDGAIYPVDYTSVKKLEGADLAVLEFKSEQAYQVATLVDYGNKESLPSQTGDGNETIRQIAQQVAQEVQAGKRPWQDIRLHRNPYWVFVYGWGRVEGSTQAHFTAGKYYRSTLDGGRLGSYEENLNIQDGYNNISPLRTGIITSIFTHTNLDSSKAYEVVYTNPSFGGMSGGPVLDARGNVAAIHTAAEGKRERSGFLRFSDLQLGYSTGVLIGTFLRLASTAGIESQWLNIGNPVLPITTLEESDSIVKNSFNLTPPKNDEGIDWLNHGNHLWRLFRYEQAITAFEQAVKLEPSLAEAHYLQGKTLERIAGDLWLAETTSNQNHQAQINPTEKIQQVLQSQKKYLQTIQSAFNAYQKATEVQPDFYQAWREQGDLLPMLPSIKSDLLKLDELSRIIGTISNEDLNEAINNSGANESETLSSKLQAIKAGYLQALEAYNKAIAINPKDSYLYSRQGNVLFYLDRCSAAIESFNKAISINPIGLYYRQRTIAHLALRELEKAETDYNRYRELDPTSYSRDNFRSVFLSRNNLNQWVQMSDIQKQQLLQLTEDSGGTLDFPGDCLSSNY